MKVTLKNDSLFIEFSTNEKTKLNDIFQISFSPDGNEHYFIAESIETIEDSPELIKVTAKECGMWTTYLTKSKLDFDIRDIQFTVITKIADPDKARGIRNQSSAY